MDPVTAKLYGEVAKAAFAPEPANVISGGGPLDARAFLGAGQGWTVSTGRGAATGGALSDPFAAAYGPGVASAAFPDLQQAGPNGLLMLALASVAIVLILRKRRG